jgi:hypothetical protein
MKDLDTPKIATMEDVHSRIGQIVTHRDLTATTMGLRMLALETVTILIDLDILEQPPSHTSTTSQVESTQCLEINSPTRRRTPRLVVEVLTLLDIRPTQVARTAPWTELLLFLLKSQVKPTDSMDLEAIHNTLLREAHYRSNICPIPSMELREKAMVIKVKVLRRFHAKTHEYLSSLALPAVMLEHKTSPHDLQQARSGNHGSENDSAGPKWKCHEAEKS